MFTRRSRCLRRTCWQDQPTFRSPAPRMGHCGTASARSGGRTSPLPRPQLRPSQQPQVQGLSLLEVLSLFVNVLGMRQAVWRLEIRTTCLTGSHRHVPCCQLAVCSQGCLAPASSTQCARASSRCARQQHIRPHGPPCSNPGMLRHKQHMHRHSGRRPGHLLPSVPRWEPQVSRGVPRAPHHLPPSGPTVGRRLAGPAGAGSFRAQHACVGPDQGPAPAALGGRCSQGSERRRPGGRDLLGEPGSGCC